MLSIFNLFDVFFSLGQELNDTKTKNEEEARTNAK